MRLEKRLKTAAISTLHHTGRFLGRTVQAVYTMPTWTRQVFYDKKQPDLFGYVETPTGEQILSKTLLGGGLATISNMVASHYLFQGALTEGQVQASLIIGFATSIGSGIYEKTRGEKKIQERNKILTGKGARQKPTARTRGEREKEGALLRADAPKTYIAKDFRKVAKQIKILPTKPHPHADKPYGQANL